MGNSLGIELGGKYVVLRKSSFAEDGGYGSAVKRVFLVGGGFGASNFTMGTALMGTFVFDGEQCRWDSYNVERLATEPEIEEAKRLRERYSKMKDFCHVSFVVSKADFEEIHKNYKITRAYSLKFHPVHFDGWMDLHEPTPSEYHLVVHHTDKSKSHTSLGEHTKREEAVYTARDITEDFTEHIKTTVDKCSFDCKEALET